MIKWLSLGIGGLAGTFARYALAGFVYRIFGTDFPYGTFVVNLSGCFLIGFLATLADEKFLLSPNARILLMIGFCGAFTTFSTFILESVHLLRDGEILRAFANVVGSVIAGFFVFWIGVVIGKLI